MQRRSHGKLLPLVTLAALFYFSSDLVVSFVSISSSATAKNSPPYNGLQQPARFLVADRQASVGLRATGQLSGKPIKMADSLLRVNMPGDFSDKFKNVHWIWQHAYQRFQCSKLASGSIPDADLPRAWELVYNLGAVHHNEVEDELFFPFVKKLDGGEAAVGQLTKEHEELDAKAEKIEDALKVSLSDARSLVQEWAQMYSEHIDHEEQLLVPIVLSGMREDLWKDVAPKIKEKSSEGPGSKMALCLFQELSYHPLLGRQYEKNLPGFLRWVLIPALSKTDSDYSDHRRIFGAIPKRSLALL